MVNNAKYRSDKASRGLVPPSAAVSSFTSTPGLHQHLQYLKRIGHRLHSSRPSFPDSSGRSVYPEDSGVGPGLPATLPVASSLTADAAVPVSLSPSIGCQLSPSAPTCLGCEKRTIRLFLIPVLYALEEGTVVLLAIPLLDVVFGYIILLPFIPR